MSNEEAANEQKQPQQGNNQPNPSTPPAMEIIQATAKHGAPHQTFVARTRTRKKIMLESLEKTHGIVIHAATLAGMNRQTHYRWMLEDPEYAKKVKEFEQDALDMAESVVQVSMAKVSDNPKLALQAAQFYLENKGGTRGYGKAGVAVQVNTQICPIAFKVPKELQEEASLSP